MLHTVKSGKGQYVPSLDRNVALWDVMLGPVCVGSILKIDQMMKDPRWPFFIADFAGVDPYRLRDAMHRLVLEIRASKRIRTVKRVFSVNIDRTTSLDVIKIRYFAQAVGLRHEWGKRYFEG